MKILILLIFSFFSLTVLSQDLEISTSDLGDIDTNYIEDFSDKLVLRSFLKRKFNELEIEDNKNDRKILYKPNQSFSLGGGFNYKWLGIDLAFKLPQAEGQEETFGKTKAFDFQANIYMRKFAIDVFYLKYQGYYIENSDEYGQLEDKIQDSKLESGIIGVNLNYLFNHSKFSYRAAYLQNERQKKSAGTFLLGGYFNRNNIKSDSSIIPKDFWTEFNEAALITNAQFTQIGAQFGYAHSLVLKKFYLTVSLGIGIGFQNAISTSIVDETITNNNSVTSKAQSRIAFGYNGDRLNLGFQNTTDTFILGDRDETSANYKVGSFRFFLAYRFKAPKLLEKIGHIKIF